METDFRRISARESQVLELLSRGCSDKDIVRVLALSKRTVRTYIERLFEKTGQHSRAGLVAAWLRDLHGQTAAPVSDSPASPPAGVR